MNKDKQIEEMAKTILDVDRSYYGMECDDIQAKAEATAIYDKGYRKASEVAREIFEEIEDLWNTEYVVGNLTAEQFKDKYAELKKKYTNTEGGE